MTTLQKADKLAWEIASNAHFYSQYSMSDTEKAELLEKGKQFGTLIALMVTEFTQTPEPPKPV